MSNNSNTLFWVICGAVIVTTIFLLISSNYGDGLSKVFGNFNSLFNNGGSVENSELAKYYNHEPNYKDLVITPESDFVFNEETREISGYRGNKNKIVIPYEINGIPVEKISYIGFGIMESHWGMCYMERDMYFWDHGNYDGWYEYAIQRGLLVDNNGNCYSLAILNEVVIPNTVKVIGYGSFYYQEINDINIPNSVEEIGEVAFQYATLGGEYIASSNIKKIGEYAFQGSRLTKVDLSKAEKLTNIGRYAFSENQISNKVIIPKNILEIGQGAFSGNQISEVDLSKSTKLNIIESGVFNVNKLTSIEIPNNIIEVGGYAFSNNQITEAKILGTNTVIRSEVFYQNNNLNTIKVPNSAYDFYRSQSSLSQYIIERGDF